MELTAACGRKHDRASLDIVAHVGPQTGASGLFPEGTVNHG